jgi:polysaccharide biosynthesis transport protein
VDLRGQLSVVRSWLLVIVFAGALAAIAAFVLSGFLPPSYEAPAQVRVQATQTGASQVDANQIAVSQARLYSEIAKTDAFASRVIARLPAGSRLSLDEYRSKVTIAADNQLPLIKLVATDGKADGAVTLAKAAVDELVATAMTPNSDQSAPSAFVQRQLGVIADQIDAAITRIDLLEGLAVRTAAQDTELRSLLTDVIGLRQTYSAFVNILPAGSELAIIDPPRTPTAMAAPRPLLNALVSGILGILVATGVAFVWEKLDDRVRTPEDVEAVTGLPTIGTVVRMPGDRNRKEFYRLATLLYPRSVAAEAFRTIRTNLEFASLDRDLRTLTITSALSGEGKSVVSANLAVAFAQAGRRTILVDADLRRPGVHELFSVVNTVGLTDMMLSDSVDLRLVAKDTEEPNLRIVTSGTTPANPAELLGSQRMAAILQRLLADADLVVLDTPPVAAVTDAALLAARSDSTLLVVNPDRSSERMVRKAREALRHVNARVVGVVLNNVSARDAEANAYYGMPRSKDVAKGPPKAASRAAGIRGVDVDAESGTSQVRG